MTRSRVAVARSLDDVLAEPGVRTLAFGASKDPNPKVTVLVFDGASRRPRCAVKVPFTDAAASAVDRERNALDAVRAAVGNEKVRLTIPEPLENVSFDGRTALMVSALDGTPMTTRYHRWHHTAHRRSVSQDFRAASAWLAELQRHTAQPAAPVTLGTDTVAGIRRRFGDAAAERVALVAERLNGVGCGRTAVHGDFWFGNLLIDEGGVCGVVDWEFGSASGEPLSDLVRFPIAYALYLDRHTVPGRRVAGHPGLRARWGAGVAYALDGSGWFSEIVRSYVRSGLERLGLSSELWRVAFLLGIAQVAATADHDEFARRHLELFDRLVAPR